MNKLSYWKIERYRVISFYNHPNSSISWYNYETQNIERIDSIESIDKSSILKHYFKLFFNQNE